MLAAEILTKDHQAAPGLISKLKGASRRYETVRRDIQLA